MPEAGDWRPSQLRDHESLLATLEDVLILLRGYVLQA